MFRAVLSRALILALAVTVLAGIAMPSQAQEMRVRDIPIPDEATDVSVMKRRGDIRFQVPSDFKTAGASYAKKLVDQKWTKSGKDNLQSNFWVQKFSKGKGSLEVRVDSQGDGSEVRLTPKGLMWEEDDQPTPKDLPLPKDATELEYDDFFESIEFKTPSNLKAIAEFLSKELGERKWTKEATEVDVETFVRLKFTHGKSSLEISIRAEDAGSEVAIRTKGMNWDGMKAEIERAEKEAEKIAAARKKEMADKPAELPRRKDKPKQGIALMPKLPSEGIVIMDDTTYKLPSVIAYEVYENKQWSTRIVATLKPIKQNSLLANLKKTGNDKDADGSPVSWPQPYLMVELDEEDRPSRLALQADGTPGSASGSGLSGEALVEDGRARGTIKMKEPGSFFKKVYEAEISFDVPVLKRDSAPAKRLVDAPKLATSGTLTIGGKTYKLANAVAYEMKQFDKPMTTIALTEKPLNLTKLKAAVGKKSADDYFEFVPQVRLVIDGDDKVTSMHIWADSTSISGSGDVDGDVVIEGARARGTAKMTKPGDFFDKKYDFTVSFDVEVLGKPASATANSNAPKSDSPGSGLVEDSHDGLPFPEGGDGVQSEGSKFRKQTSKTIAADLKAVIDFYQRDVVSADWAENKAAAKIDKTSATMSFTTPSGIVIVRLKSEGTKTAITLVTRDAEAAKAAGVLPATGKSRLIIGNTSDDAAVLTISKREYKLAAGAGAQDPKTGLNWDVAPGKYPIEVKLPGKGAQSEVLTIGLDEAWGLMILPTGDCLPVQLY
jgi:hypothetical protein